MLKNFAISSKNKGFSIVEVLVSVLIISILTLGVFSLIILSLKITKENQYYVNAIEIANQRMEKIRNMPYDEVGVASGTPMGSIPQVEYVHRPNAGYYTIHNYVVFYDDPFDGELGSTTRPDTIIDYKIATIQVSWQSNYGQKNVTIFSKIIPRTEETTAGYGLLKISVVDANGAPITGASTTVISTDLGIHQTNLTNNDGILYLPVPALSPATSSGYQVIVGKNGYGQDQTYPVTTENPNPTKRNLFVSAGNKQEESFSIDRLATLNIKTLSNNLSQNWQVNSTVADTEKTHPKIAVDSNDNLYFTWQSSNSTSSSVFIQKYNSTEVKQWINDIKIYNSKFQKNPDIAVTGSGRSFVVWQDNSAALKITLGQDQMKLASNKNKLPLADYKIKINFKNSNDIFLNIIADKIKTANSQLTKMANKIATNIKITLAKNQRALRNGYQKFSRQINGLISPEIKQANAGVGNIVFVGIGTGAVTGNTNSIALDVPGGVQVGDLLLAFIEHDDYSDGPINAPAGYGWNTLNSNLQPICLWFESDCDSRGAIFWKIVAAGNPSLYTFSLPSGRNEQKAGHIRAYRGVNSSDPFDGSLNTATTDTDNRYHSAPSHSVSNDNSMLVCGWGTDTETLGNYSPIFPSGMLNVRNNYANEITAASADKTVNISDSPTGSQVFDARHSVNRKSISWCLVLNPATIPDDVMVTAAGSQVSNLMIPSNNEYLGGNFVITDTTGNHTINSIKIKEGGTINAGLSLSNVKLFYDFDTTAPYDCSSEQYDAGSDLQFGSADSFDSSSEAVFTNLPGLEISTVKSLCLYVVLDINSSAVKNDTIDIYINNPSTDIALTSGTVMPNSPTSLPGATVLLKPAEMQQIHYRWRNNDGDENDASWKTGQDIVSSITKDNLIRLRLEISNGGSVASDPVNYRLEYAEKQTTCSAILTGDWSAVPTNDSGHWKIIDSVYLTDSDNTTNISGLTDENVNFKEGEIKDSGNETSAIILQSTDFTELEYALQATNNANNSDYCFRLSNAGSVNSFFYSVYPEISVIGDDNIYLISYDSNGNILWMPKKVNDDMSSAAQINPTIAITENFGTATSVVAWEDYQNGNSDIYIQSFDINGNKAWPSGNIAIASTPDYEVSPSIIINQSDEIFISWTVVKSPAAEIYLQKIDLATGGFLWPSSKKIIISSNSVFNGQLTLGENNNVYLTYVEDSDSNKNVMIAKFDNDGNEVWAPILANISSTDKDQYDPCIAFKNDLVYVAWTDKRENNEDIYVQKYNKDGAAQWLNDQRININLDLSAQNKPALTINSTGLGEPFAVWPDYRDSNSNIYATKFSNPGSLVGYPNVPLNIKGTSLIGDNPVILEHNELYTTNGVGDLTLNVEWDTPGYTISTSTSTPLSIFYSDPSQPLSILPGEIKTILLYVK
ncbi:MAG: hypothetical protein BWY51_00388 [Parcubacteria group bacterium ADurb.Bin316]|nr:MAG: hypothetical protein BWY51_00388 [Parcubacteria group bacterium ADurb.Bin316]HOZ56413.1 prepilin-type N-terminal cleavage/methylation domain-containing protein [bacterium]